MPDSTDDSTEQSAPEGAASALCHDLLMAVAGQAPDDLITTARGWVAQEHHLDVARALVFAVLSQRIPLSESAVQGLGDLFSINGVDDSALRHVDLARDEPPPPFVFMREPHTETVVPERARPAEAAPDDAVGAAVQGAAVRGVWRAWRHTADGSPWPPPRPVYLVEVERVEDRHHVAAALAEALESAGESWPQVEVHATGDDVWSYQRAARDAGELVWAASPDRAVQMVQLFDRTDDDGEPAFASDRARIEAQDERERLAGYLDAGAPLLVTTARGDDVLDPARGAVVPMSFRTDGTWIWSEAVTYYLREHGIRPQDAFAQHLDQVADTPPSVDGVDLHRAAAALSE